MQKVLRRAQLAQRQARRVKEAEEARRRNDELKINRANLSRVQQSKFGAIKAHRKARREDWELGPLAPRRAVGADTETYGAATTTWLYTPKVPEKERMKILPLDVGDRVVILEGRDKGQVGEVVEVDDESETLQVKGKNLIEVVVPSFIRDYSQGTEDQATQSIAHNMPLSKVALVYPIFDAETKTKRDVMIRLQHIRTKESLDDFGEKKRQRFVKLPSQRDVEVPFQDIAPVEQTSHPDDTSRLEVDAETFVPTLRNLPFPPSVLDELRGKYSKFRTRHDAEYIEKKEAEDRERALAKSQGVSYDRWVSAGVATPEDRAIMMERMRNMVTPGHEARREERKARKSRGWPGLAKADLEALGEQMARNLGIDATSMPDPTKADMTSREGERKNKGRRAEKLVER